MCVVCGCVCERASEMVLNVGKMNAVITLDLESLR